MRRILIYSRTGTPLGEINPNDVLSAVLREEINGEHSLELTTTQVLDKGVRLLHQDGRGKWREFTVDGVDADHSAGITTIGTYYCPWSIQEDLSGVTVSVMPGTQTPVMASVALTALLSSQSRWAVGTVTNTATGGASMYDRSAWDALSTLVEVWGGEIDVTIGVSAITGVIARSVDLYSQQGNQTAKRRFDFGADARGIKRKLADGALYCRISPRGKGEQTDSGGYGRKITIESVNAGKDYLEYTPMVAVARIPNGSDGYLYPTKIVENSDCETPAELKAWAQTILADECTPKVTYELDVLQSDEAGTSVQGVSLGDAVQVVDTRFGAEGIRVEARVTSITTDLVAERVESIELGSPEETISAKFDSVNRSVAAISNQLTVMATPEYVSNLLDRINQEVNATGGYTYITEGQGLRTYDVAVSDPLIGAEASQVVEIKGGNIRIANSKTAQGEWEWKTVLQSGHILADLVTAAKLTSGFIGSAQSGNYWDLDTGELRMAQTAMLGNKTVSQVLSDVSGANEIAFEAIDENLIPFTDALDADHGWLLSANATGDGALSVLLTAQASGYRSARTPFIPYYLVRERDVALSFRAVAGTAGTTLGVSFELWHKGDTARYGRIDTTVTLSTSTQSFSVLQTLSDAAFTLNTGEAIAATDYLRIGFWNSAANVAIRVSRIKLQLGSVVSTWRPSSSQPAADAAVEAQTQEYVFNKLTANGTLQGLYMSNGQLYVNANYIQTGLMSANLIKGGTLVMGGANNTNGIIQVKDASGNVVCLLNNAGIEATGTLKMMLGGFTTNGKVYAELKTFTIPNFILNVGNRTAKGLQIYRSGDTVTQNVSIAALQGSQTLAGSVLGDSAIAANGALSISGLQAKGAVVSNIEFSAEVSASNGTVDINAGSWSSSNGFVGFHVAVLKGSTQFTHYVRSGVYTNPLYISPSGISTDGTKSRLVSTDNYNERLLYCYETPTPTFGDIGSGTLDENGLCYVEIDDVFAETANTLRAYQVFLQKCGNGDLWVAEKHPSYFVVQGTPNLQFDWEVKARQTGYEHTRLEQLGIDEVSIINADELPNPEDVYHDYIEEIEQALYA